MDTVDLIRCSRCDKHLTPEAFASSHQNNGNWCRECRRIYMSERYAAVSSRPRNCCMCGISFTRWEKWDHPGSAARRCKPCYDDYVRARTGATKRSPLPPDTSAGYRPQGRRWKELRASVIAEETHCGICGEMVDKATPKWTRGAPTVDHITPLSVGGDYYDRANLRLAHHGCNSARGHRQLKEAYECLLADHAQLKQRLAELEGSPLLGSSRFICT